MHENLNATEITNHMVLVFLKILVLCLTTWLVRCPKTGHGCVCLYVSDVTIYT